MSDLPTCLGGVLTTGEGSENSEHEQQEKLSYSLVPVDDGDVHDDRTDISEPTPSQALATSTPARNLDLLTGMNTSELLEPPSSQSTKRKRTNPSPTILKPIQLSDSIESLKQISKRANKENSGADSAHSARDNSGDHPDTLTILVRPPTSSEPIDIPDPKAGPAVDTEGSNDYIVYEETDLGWHSPNTMSLYNASSTPPFVVFIESTVSGLNLGKLDPIKVIDFLSPHISGGKRVSRTGINQIKVECERFQSANDLVASVVLKGEGFRMFIPDTYLHKRGSLTGSPRSVRLGTLSGSVHLMN